LYVISRGLAVFIEIVHLFSCCCYVWKGTPDAYIVAELEVDQSLGLTAVLSVGFDDSVPEKKCLPVP
jgi:hypothetical protein